MAILSDISINDYHRAAPAWLSKTSLMAFRARGPAWWRMRYLEHRIFDKDTKSMAQGRALDDLLTGGPETFARNWAIKPEGLDGRTAAGKEWVAENANRGHLSADEFATLTDAADAVRRCCAWKDIERSMSQRTVRRASDGLGVGFQARPDWMRNDGTILWDLKKTADLARFGAQAIDLGYHLQAALAGWCLAGDHIALDHAYLVAVEWERGARCRVFQITDEQLSAGFELCRNIAQEIARRLADNDWIEQQHAPEPLTPPEWMQRKMLGDV